LVSAEGAARLSVLHVVEATLGGVRAYLQGLAVASAGLPIAPSIAYAPNRADPQFWGVLEQMRSLGWQTYELPMLREVNPRADIRGVRELRELLAILRPDIVHSHSAKAGAVGRLAALSLAGRRPALVHAPHALPVGLGNVYQVAEWFLGHACTDVVTAMCESERRQIVQAGVCKAPVLIVRPLVDSEFFRPRDRARERHALGLPLGKPLAVGIGRLVDQKDPLTFVRAVADARSEVEDITAIWVGDGELREATEALAAELGLADRFSVTGWVPDVRAYIGACDVVMLPSRYESFGYVTAEALSMGRAVVGTTVPGTVDLIDGPAFGDLLPVGDAEALGRALAHRVVRPELTDPVVLRSRIQRSHGPDRVSAELSAAYAMARPLPRRRAG
jgi:glycosyltransferase involved in cell wall biosynthesis